MQLIERKYLASQRSRTRKHHPTNSEVTLTEKSSQVFSGMHNRIEGCIETCADKGIETPVKDNPLRDFEWEEQVLHAVNRRTYVIEFRRLKTTAIVKR